MTIAHESASSPPINVYANQPGKEPPAGVPESHVWIRNVTSTSERWGRMLGAPDGAVTVENCTHNGEAVR